MLNTRLILGTTLAAAAVANTAAQIPQLSFLFNTSTRWLALLALAAVVTLLGRTGELFRTPIWLPAVTLCIWNFTTFTWSEQPDLSRAKSVAFALTLFALVTGAISWARRENTNLIMAPLAGFAAVALAAMLLGLTVSTAYDNISEGWALYQGAIKGSNAMGVTQAMALPFVTVALYRFWHNFIARTLCLAVGGLMIFAIIQTGSRAAMLLVICIGLGSIAGLGTKRLLRPLLITAGIVTLIIGAGPESISQHVFQTVYKTKAQDASLLATREAEFAVSLAAAKYGALKGVGFGVSTGATPRFTGGLTAVGYGREKGNSQLGTIEEIGAIGCALFVALIIIVLVSAISALRLLTDTEQRLQLGVLTGTICGLIVHSFFEAWWLAPGAPESGFFWTVLGLSYGLAMRAKQQALEVSLANTRTYGLRRPTAAPAFAPRVSLRKRGAQ